MSKKTVSLTVHRNTIERRHRKDMQEAMVRSAKAMGESDIRAYAIVAFRADGGALSSWDTGSIMPLWGFAPTVGATLAADIGESGVDDTWNPALGERSRPPE